VSDVQKRLDDDAAWIAAGDVFPAAGAAVTHALSPHCRHVGRN
jgi:hypothetical protein